MARELRARHPGTPLIALSSNFCAGVEANGAVAHALGVDAVLPKPQSASAVTALGEIQQGSFQGGNRREDGFFFVQFVILHFHHGIQVTPVAPAERAAR